MSRWKKWWMQLKQVILDTEAVISLAVGAEQIAQPIPGSPSSTGTEPFSEASTGQSAPSPGGSITVHTQFRLCFQNSKAAPVEFTEKQTGFVPFHPGNTHKKISTLYKEQQRYNLNMHQLQTIYTEKQAYTNRTGPFITLQFWGSFWRKEITADEQNQTEGGGCCFWK